MTVNCERKSGWRARRFWAFFALLLSTACNNCDCGKPNLVEVPPNQDQQDEFCQRPASKVDVLWIIDNSGSMTAEQNKIADRFSNFFKQLTTSLVDYHIGVITTSMREGFNVDVNGILRQYNGPAVPGCNGCRFLTKDVPCNPDNMDRRPEESTADYEVRLRGDCPAVLVFRQLVHTGNTGQAFETGLVASTVALGAVIDPETGQYQQAPSGGPVIPSANEGFIRHRSGACNPTPGAAGLDCSTQEGENCAEPSLYVIYVSDEQDNSAGLPRYYYRVLEGLKGAGNEAKISASAITGWPLSPAVGMERACDILRASWDSDSTNDGDLVALNTILAQSDNSNPACRDTTDVDMGTNSAVVGSRYIEVVCRTGGKLANICSEDYSSALEQLGADAAGLARRFTFSKWDEVNWGPDGRPLTGDDPMLNCDGSNRQVDENRGLCVHATAMGQDHDVLVPRDAVNGYHLEASTHSIRFDGTFLPKPGTKVSLYYQLLNAQQKQQP